MNARDAPFSARRRERYRQPSSSHPTPPMPVSASSMAYSEVENVLPHGTTNVQTGKDYAMPEKYHNPGEMVHGEHYEKHEEKGSHKMGEMKAPHVHIDNREGLPMGGYGYGCGGGCGDGFGGGMGFIMGALLGGGGFGGFGRGHHGGDCGHGRCNDIDLRDSIVSDLERQNIDRDILKESHSLSLQMCGVDKDVIECCCKETKEILENRYLASKDSDKEMFEIFKTKCDLEKQIGKVDCEVKDGFKNVCHQIKDLGAVLVNSDATSAISSILAGLTAAPTDAQLAALQTNLSKISTKVSC